jgi:HSP20 family protein
MARTQAETKSNMPATISRGRGRNLMARDAAAWAANPFGLMRRLSDDMDQLFGQLVGGLSGTGPVSSAQQLDWVPAIEVDQREGQLLVRADLPGMDVDDVTVEVDAGVLTIAGERRDEREVEGDGGGRRTEVRYGRFARSIALPEGAQSDEIEAAFRNGVLEIKIPMAQQAPSQRRKIDVQSASDSNGGQKQSSTASPGASSASSQQNAASREQK